MENIPMEKDLILDKTVLCKVCDTRFKTKAVKSGKVRRLEPDIDLRPRSQYIDGLKYDVISCPNCGYTAMSRYFSKISPAQVKLVREGIASKFEKGTVPQEEVYSYDTAILRHKLALANAVVKRGRDSEQAYICLKIAWLLREVDLKDEAETYYRQAYDGFIAALSKEDFPIAGMDQGTFEYLLSYLAYHFGDYQVAAKLLGGVITSKTASMKLKDMARDLKDMILGNVKK